MITTEKILETVEKLKYKCQCSLIFDTTYSVGMHWRDTHCYSRKIKSRVKEKWSSREYEFYFIENETLATNFGKAQTLITDNCQVIWKEPGWYYLTSKSGIAYESPHQFYLKHISTIIEEKQSEINGLLRDISALNNAGLYDTMIQKINISTELNKTNILELGRQGPYHKYVNFPIESNSIITVKYCPTCKIAWNDSMGFHFNSKCINCDSFLITPVPEGALHKERWREEQCSK